MTMTLRQVERAQRHRPWTRGEERRLKALLDAGWSTHRIGRALGRTRKAVACRRLELQKKESSDG